MNGTWKVLLGKTHQLCCLQSYKLSGYFTTGGASNPLDEGKEVTWDFHDFPGAFPVQVKQTIKNKKIVLEWANSEGGSTQVVMNFEPLGKDSTLVRIEEYGWNNQIQKSLDESYSHCQGWMQMLCCLKVYVEFGKNLRVLFLILKTTLLLVLPTKIDSAYGRVIKSLSISVYIHR